MAPTPQAAPPTEPDPRTAADDDDAYADDATPAPGNGVSSPDPAEGSDDLPGEGEGSPRG